MEHVADHLNVHMHRCYAYRQYVCISYHNSSIIIAARGQPLTLAFLSTQSTAISQDSSNVESHCHIPTVASLLTEEMSLSTRRSVHQLPTNTRPNSLHYGLQVCTIMASKCISTLTRLLPLNSLDHSLQLYLQTSTVTASKFARSWPPSASTTTLNHNLAVHL